VRVLNKRARDAYQHQLAIYIGRPTRWGNPYREGVDGTRAEVIAKFEELVRGTPWLLAAVKKELKGKDLVCWCAPLPCHGDVLLRIASEE
jgi:hypothetical protein